MSKPSEISSLIKKYLFNKLTIQEEQKLNEWINSSERNQILFNQLTDKNLLDQKIKKYGDIYPDSLWKKTKLRISASSGVDLDQEPEMMNINPKTIYRLIAAVIILTLIGLVAAIFLLRSNLG